MAYQMDFYGAQSYDSVLSAIKANKVKYPSYIFIRDEDAESGRLAFMDNDGALRFVRDEEQKSLVARVDSLPDVSEGDENTLYIYEDVVYVFNGSEFKPQYVDHTAEFEELTTKIAELEEKTKELETSDATLSEQIAALDEKIDAIEIPEECKCVPNNKYETVKTPVGTLVDYFDKEIRIMIPADTDFAAQENGVNGAENMFYIENRIFAPEDAVRYKVNFGGTVTEGAVADFAGCTDEYDRIYLVVCPPVAYYDTASAAWTYYGANSATSHYIGWDLITEWYDADGNTFESDAIRINLSNEQCHYAIEPYYISEVTNTIASLEEKVSELEAGSMTFVELE